MTRRVVLVVEVGTDDRTDDQVADDVLFALDALASTDEAFRYLLPVSAAVDDTGRPPPGGGSTADRLASEVRRFLSIPVMKRGVGCGPEWADEWLKECLRNEVRCSDVQRLADALADFDQEERQ